MAATNRFSNSLSERPVRWALIADDLTGAADTAVEFCEAGFTTAVCMSLDAVERCDAEICAVTSETREVDVAAAVPEMERWSAVLRDAGRRLVFKKIDSLLRGNVALETEALVRRWGFDYAVLSPALPRLGRGCRDGMLTTQDGQAVRLPQSNLLATPDAETDADLSRLVAGVLEADTAVLLAGSSGLGQPWAKALAAMHGRSSVDSLPPVLGKPTLCLIGSVHPRTLAQMDYAVSEGIVEEIDLVGAARDLTGPSRLVRVAIGDVGRDWEEELRAVVRSGQFGSLLVSGGSTAQLVFGALDADCIEIGGSSTTGAPWGAIRGGMADGLVVVTKSGAFGVSDELARILALLGGKGTRTE